MTRRLTFTIVGIVLATLVLVGGGTLAVASIRARSTTARELRSQVVELAAATTETLTEGVDESATDAAIERTLTRRLAVLRRFGRLLRLDDVAIIVVDRRGLRTDPPPPVTIADLDTSALASGAVLDGHRGGVVWAATATEPGPSGRYLAVVLTQKVSRGLGDAVRWFLVAALTTVVLGAMAALALGRRLTRPVRDASQTAHRIAAGDLSARMPEATGRDDELDELARSINTMAGELERARGLEQEFLLSVSHDLRTPLTSIRGYAEAILDGAGPPDRSAAVILSEAQRLERLVADLLDLAKLRSAGFRVEPAPIDLVAVIEASVAGFEPSHTDRAVTVRTGTLDPVVVLADRDRLGQVLANLIENGTKYARTTVEVASVRTNLGAWLVVDDDGAGISADDLPHVFERLYVSRHAPQRRENSSGLGLAITHELVIAMGGSITAERSPMGGARFLVTLPAGHSAR